jgi:hypothetical protein
MNTKLSMFNLRRLLFFAAIITISAGLCLGALPISAQDTPPPPPPQQQQQAPPPPSQQMGQQQAGPPPEDQIPIPPMLNLPAGTLIQIRINNELSSEHNQAGDRFSASLEQPIIANGWVVARRGQLLTGRVVSVKKAGRISGTSQLGVEIVELTFVDGQILPVHTSLVQYSGGTTYGRDAGTVVGTTGLGAIIGGAAEGGGGAAVGAGIGAGAGILAVLTTRGRPTILFPETMLTFRLEAPLDISTERGQIAFQPVGQNDYPQDQDRYAQRQQLVHRPAYGPGYGYPYAYPYAYVPYNYYAYPYYWSPYPYFGFYSGFGFRGGYGYRGGRRR